ncbi:Asp23/Gls24 family envelope stress response protein [Streptomyces sp. AK02-04a]|uniref:Asp23/Gls24 family envelope stress response protein n=1 Tax=Streptomyces sp. AK02-04a TaxID=3028649 RepID=UPI0029A2D20F|nr:Asp23/Gls24 family envelope stress response protein [Streptomyces sp. AK02-04a]MDX3763396.1 Asp23/Gls24 family envelope stress response protein [Streptomyces sp. AK02-04a]
MTADGNVTELTERIAQAVGSVPGVAFLRPGLAGLLRASVMSRVPDRVKADGRFGGDRTKSAVRVRQGDASGALAIDVSIVLRRGHRALDVTRAVSDAVEQVVPTPTGGKARIRVTVTVTGLV